MLKQITQINKNLFISIVIFKKWKKSRFRSSRRLLENLVQGKLKLFSNRLREFDLRAGPFGAIYGDTSIPECGLTLRKAVDASVNYIDTAPWYGQGELT